VSIFVGVGPTAFVSSMRIFGGAVLSGYAVALEQDLAGAWSAANLEDDLARAFSNAVHPKLFPQLEQELEVVSTAARRAGASHEYGKQTTYFFDMFGEHGVPQKPRCAIETAIKMLYDMDFDSKTNSVTKPGIRGAEWWIQTKGTTDSIGFHFDKDEAHASINGEMKYPTVSTITYMGSTGAPTLILNQTTPDGNDLSPKHPTNGHLVFPEANKHVIFRGNLNHGVEGAWAKSDAASSTGVITRTTFLINWWQTKPLPPNCHRITEVELKGLRIYDPEGAPRMYHELSESPSHSAIEWRNLPEAGDRQRADSGPTLVAPPPWEGEGSPDVPLPLPAPLGELPAGGAIAGLDAGEEVTEEAWSKFHDWVEQGGAPGAKDEPLPPPPLHGDAPVPGDELPPAFLSTHAEAHAEDVAGDGSEVPTLPAVPPLDADGNPPEPAARPRVGSGTCSAPGGTCGGGFSGVKTVRHRIELPPRNSLYLQLPEEIDAGSYALRWEAGECVGGISRLDLEHDGAMRVLLGSEQPKLLVFVTPGEQQSAAEDWLIPLSTEHDGELMVTIADPSTAAEAMENFELGATDVPTAVIHDTAAGRHYIFPRPKYNRDNLLDQAKTEAWVAKFFAGQLKGT
jgi:hypothetical protein